VSSYSKYAVGVMILLPDNRIVVIEEPSKPPPTLPKFPIGQSTKEEENLLRMGYPEGEVLRIVGVREAEEETGISMRKAKYHGLVHRETRRLPQPHDWVLKEYHLPFIPAGPTKGQDGQRVSFLTAREILSNPRFHKDHLQAARKRLEEIAGLR